jgi:fucose permease
MMTPTNATRNGGKKVTWFRMPDGTNYAYVFLIVCSLFLLWGVCNGMIDVLNKHFQDSNQLTKAESASVQFANYMGYFLMAIPAGLLAVRFGYKGAILIGLGLIGLGALWFIPAVHIGSYWAFLLGLFIVAAGLPCLETVCNPYTTVLGPPESGAARINLAQSTNGIGWMIGPVLAGYFVLSATGEPVTTNTNLWKPYLIIAGLVAILILIFAVSKVPDLHNVEESKVEIGGGKVVVKPLWKRWHFVLAVAAQFFYVAAQTGIFSFFINYVATDTPALSQGQANELQSYAHGLHTAFRIPITPMTYPAALFSASDVTNISAWVAKLQNDPNPKTKPISDFIWSQFGANQEKLAASDGQAIALLGIATNAFSIPKLSTMPLTPEELAKKITQEKKAVLIQGLNKILQTNQLFAAMRSSGLALPEAQRRLVESNPSGEHLARANREFLEDTYPPGFIARCPYLNAPLFRITDRGGSLLLSFGGFLLFLIGRITGSFALRVFRADRMLALYSAANILMMILTMNAWGWWSVAGLFLSFFFMSIGYPTIFSLGIHGLGEKTKIGSSFIVQSIVGGAIMPFVMGWLADNWGMRIGFLMPLVCFVFIAFYGLVWKKLEARDAAE